MKFTFHSAMGLLGIALPMLLVMTAAFQVSIEAVYKVGDSAGWTTIGNVDYKQWAATKDFKIGDIIIFEYNAQFHNVMRVTHAMYKICNASAPIATFTTGNDTINITAHGHHFFFCGVPGHCQAGQKVDINVLSDSEKAPSPSALVAPTVPSAGVPAPSPNRSAPLMTSNGVLSVLGTAIATLAFAFSTIDYLG